MLWESSVLDPNEVRLFNLFSYLAKFVLREFVSMA